MTRSSGSLRVPQHADFVVVARGSLTRQTRRVELESGRLHRRCGIDGLGGSRSSGSAARRDGRRIRGRRRCRRGRGAAGSPSRRRCPASAVRAIPSLLRSLGVEPVLTVAASPSGCRAAAPRLGKSNAYIDNFGDGKCGNRTGCRRPTGSYQHDCRRRRQLPTIRYT